MKKLLYLTILSTLSWLPLVASEKSSQETPISIDFEQLDDNVVGNILSHLSTADLIKIRLTGKRMLPLVETVFSERVEMLSGDDLFKIKHFAKEQCLKVVVELELLKRGKKQNEEFKKLVTGKNLALSNREIDFIYPGAFNGLVNLQWLWLEGNQLKQLDPGAFNGLDNLQSLWLEDNQLEQLDPGIFKGLINLQILGLSENQLKQLDQGIFSGLVNLQELYLSWNRLKQLDQGIFSGLVNLQELQLSGNQLKQLDLGIFNGLVNLKKLHLSRNPLNPQNMNLLRVLFKEVNITF